VGPVEVESEGEPSVVTVSAVLKAAEEAIAAAGCEDPRADASWLKALIALSRCHRESGDYAQAIGPWKKILATVPQESSMARSIAASVAKAEALAAKERGER